eukprot:scaffold23417_cov71-Phaeocystis_antarctica.AAC.5
MRVTKGSADCSRGVSPSAATRSSQLRLCSRRCRWQADKVKTSESGWSGSQCHGRETFGRDARFSLKRSAPPGGKKTSCDSLAFAMWSALTALLRSLATPKVDRRANAMVRLPLHAAACVLARYWYATAGSITAPGASDGSEREKSTRVSRSRCLRVCGGACALSWHARNNTHTLGRETQSAYYNTPRNPDLELTPETLAGFSPRSSSAL